MLASPSRIYTVYPAHKMPMRYRQGGYGTSILTPYRFDCLQMAPTVGFCAQSGVYLLLLVESA